MNHGGNHRFPRRGGALLFAFLIMSVSSIRADQTLNWDQCVGLALQKNPDLYASIASRDASAARYKSSWNGVMPFVSLTHSVNDQMGGAGSSRWQAGGRAGMDLFNLADYASIRSAAGSLSQSSAVLRQASMELRYRLRKAFADLLYAQENIDVSSRVLTIRKRNDEMIGLRYDSGRESKGNLMRSEAQLLEAKADLDQARRAIRSSAKTLSREAGADDFAVTGASGTLTSAVPPEELTSYEGIVEGHPKVQAARAAVAVNQAAVSQARASFWPTLSASYSRSWSGADYFPSDPNWTAQGLVSLPIFGSGPTSAFYGVAAARRTLDQAQQALRAARNQVISDLETAWVSWKGAVDQAMVQEKLLEAARQRNDEADIRYAGGLMNYENWEIIVSERVRAESAALQARQSAMIAQAAWERALGKELGEP